MSVEPFGRFCAPVLAVSGFSGSGKTTLLEAAIPELVRGGISVAVVKHDAHGIQIDRSGKDSDRLFQAGATVALRGPDQQFLRRQATSLLSLHATLEFLSHDHDLLLVEGHKNTPLPKFWLRDATQSEIPGDVTNVVGTLEWNTNRVREFVSFVRGWLPVAWRQRPVVRGLLLDNGPRDFPGKSLMAPESGELAQDGSIDTVVFGSGPLPPRYQNLSLIPNPPGIAAPLGALLAAHRWAPAAAWIISDRESQLSALYIDWLVSLRAPGRWAVIPRGRDSSCPVGGLFEPQALTVLERDAVGEPDGKVRIDRLIEHPRTLRVEAPATIERR